MHLFFFKKKLLTLLVVYGQCMNMHNIYYIIIRTTFRGTRFNKKVFKAPCSFSRARNLTTIEEKKGKYGPSILH
jgi:hypothetical protein